MHRQPPIITSASTLRARAASEVQLNVAVYRKAFLDAGSFIALYALIAGLDALHAASVLPAWFVLW